MKISDLKELLKDKRVKEEINKHLWIESQKAGYSIGIERATDEWIRLYADGWMKYHMSDQYDKSKNKKKKWQIRSECTDARTRGSFMFSCGSIKNPLRYSRGFFIYINCFVSLFSFCCFSFFLFWHIYSPFLRDFFCQTLYSW